MTPRSIAALASRPRPRLGLSATPKLRNRESLDSSLEKERARADRSGQGFHWVTFRLEAAATTPALRRLADVVAARVRQTDEAGWLDDTTLCAILPQTDRSGTQHFVTDLVRRANSQQIEPLVDVYSYPTTSHPGSHGATSHKHLTLMRDRQHGSVTSASKPVSVDAVCGSDPSCDRDPFVVQMPVGKRIVDILGAGFGLVLTAPIFMAAAVAIRLTSRGPIVFVQRRAGLGGRPFNMYKFRSMVVNAEAIKATLRASNEQDGPAFKIRNDPRVTRVGRLLRRTSIDELPQLINVLKGDMSLVGPRPPTFDEVANYQAWYRRRLDVTPGLTCIWQVEGRGAVPFESWMRMDMRYIQNYGWWQDLSLLVATIPAVLFRRGAH